MPGLLGVIYAKGPFIHQFEYGGTDIQNALLVNKLPRFCAWNRTLQVVHSRYTEGSSDCKVTSNRKPRESLPARRVQSGTRQLISIR